MARALLVLALAFGAFAIGSAQASTIYDVAASDAQLSDIASALTLCPDLLAATQSNTTAVTAFLPTNDALTTSLSMSGLTVAEVLANTTLLCDILEYHIATSVLMSSAVTTTAMSVPTLLAGDNVTVQLVNGTVMVNQAHVIQADIAAGSSIVHIIDSALIPPFLSSAMASPAPVPTPMPTPGMAPSPATIYDLVVNTSDLGDVQFALEACPPLLAATKNSSTAWTFFAPTNEALANALVQLQISLSALLSNETLICDLLEYHILPVVVPSSDASATAVMVATLLSGDNVTIQLVNGSVYVNNAMVTMADLMAGASIVHIIDHVLIPPFLVNTSMAPTPSPASGPTIVSVASNYSNLSDLVGLVSACPAILAAASNTSTMVTVFAPTNDAFDAALTLLGITDAQLVGNLTFLCELIAVHVLPEVVPASAASAAVVSLPTALSGVNDTVQLVNGTVEVNTADNISPVAKVVLADVAAGGSIIHVIDHVLIPSWVLPPGLPANQTMMTTIASVAAGVPTLSDFVAAVSLCPPLLAAADNSSTAVTVFAPTNTALVSALNTLGLTVPELLSNQTLLCDVLEYHVVGMVLRSSAVTTTAIMVPSLLGSDLTIQLVNGSVFVNGDAMVTTADVAAGASIIHIIDHLLIPPFLLSPSPSPSPAMAPTIASVAAGVAELSTLLTVVAASPAIYAAATNSSTAVTVFAPTNTAFANGLAKLTAALNITTDELLANQELVTAVLEYHILLKPVPASGIQSRYPAAYYTMLKGSTVNLRRKGGALYANTAEVIMADVKAGMSLVQIIDQVLLPPNWQTIFGRLLTMIPGRR